MTDGNIFSKVEQSYFYDEFGNSLGSWGSISNHYLYTGQEYDGSISSLYNLRARYYDMRIGRFGSEDPILQSGYIIHSGKCVLLKCTTNYFPLFEHQPQRLNNYLYVANNPINCFDPTGKGIVCTIDWQGVADCFGYTIDPTTKGALVLCGVIYAIHKGYGLACFTAVLGPYVWCIIENMDCYDDKKPPLRSPAGGVTGIPRPLPY